MRVSFVVLFSLVFGLILPLAAADQKPVFHGSFHRNQLLFVAAATVFANPIASAVEAFRRPVGRDILEKQTLGKSAKAGLRAMFTKKAWFSPYADLVRSFRKNPTRDITKPQAFVEFVKNHKAFTVVSSAFLADLLFVGGKYGKYCLDLRKWEKDEPARLAEAEKVRKEQEAKAEKLAGEKAAEHDKTRVYKKAFASWRLTARASRAEKQRKAQESQRQFQIRLERCRESWAALIEGESFVVPTSEEELSNLELRVVQAQREKQLAMVMPRAGIPLAGRPAAPSSAASKEPRRRSKKGTPGKGSSAGTQRSTIDTMSTDDFADEVDAVNAQLDAEQAKRQAKKAELAEKRTSRAAHKPARELASVVSRVCSMPPVVPHVETATHAVVSSRSSDVSIVYPVSNATPGSTVLRGLCPNKKFTVKFPTASTGEGVGIVQNTFKFDDLDKACTYVLLKSAWENDVLWALYWNGSEWASVASSNITPKP